MGGRISNVYNKEITPEYVKCSSFDYDNINNLNCKHINFKDVKSCKECDKAIYNIKEMPLHSKIVKFFDGKVFKSPQRSKSFTEAKQNFLKPQISFQSFNHKKNKDDIKNFPSKSRLKKFLKFISPSIIRKNTNENINKFSDADHSSRSNNYHNLSNVLYNSGNITPYDYDEFKKNHMTGQNLNDSCKESPPIVTDHVISNSNTTDLFTKASTFSDKMSKETICDEFNLCQKQSTTQMMYLTPNDLNALVNQFFDRRDSNLSKNTDANNILTNYDNFSNKTKDFSFLKIGHNANLTDEYKTEKFLENDFQICYETFDSPDQSQVPRCDSLHKFNSKSLFLMPNGIATLNKNNDTNLKLVNQYVPYLNSTINCGLAKSGSHDRRQAMALLRKNFLFPNRISIIGSAESLVQNYSFKSESKASLLTSASIRHNYASPSPRLFDYSSRGSASDYYPRLYQDGRINYTTPQRTNNIGHNCPYPKMHDKQPVGMKVNLRNGKTVVVTTANVVEALSSATLFYSHINSSNSEGNKDTIRKSDLKEGKPNSIDPTSKSSLHSDQDINTNMNNKNITVESLHGAINFPSIDSSGEEDVLYEKSILSLEDVKNRNSYYMLTSSEDFKLGDDKDENKDGNYYLSLLKREDEFIKKMCSIFEKYLDQSNIPDECEGKIRSAVGQGYLLTSKKLKQFKDLCLNYLMPDESFPPTTSQDLAGFWDLTSIEVENVRQSFIELNTLRQANWPVTAPNLKTITTTCKSTNSNPTCSLISNPTGIIRKNFTVKTTPKKKKVPTATLR